MPLKIIKKPRKYLSKEDIDRIDWACETIEDRRNVSELVKTGKSIKKRGANQNDAT